MEYYAKIWETKPKIIDCKSDEYIEEDNERSGPFFLYKRSLVFLSASLRLIQHDVKRDMEWMTWVTIPVQEFRSIGYNKGDFSMRGKLYYKLKFYEHLDVFDVNVWFHNDRDESPSIVILEGTNEIYEDYIKGVSKEKYLRWQEQLDCQK